jgi:hypothetical protein
MIENMVIVSMIIIVVILIIVVLRKGNRKEFMEVPEKKKEGKVVQRLHKPEEISEYIRDGEPDIAIATIKVNVVKRAARKLKKKVRELPKIGKSKEERSEPTVHDRRHLSKESV